MYQVHTLKNGLTVITIDKPYLESVTTLVAVGAGSRYESKDISGLSHFLEHMFFKGSKKYPSTAIIAGLIEGIGADNNAGTNKEYTTYWIKSAAGHIELAVDILASQIKESLLQAKEIDREKGVIIEELKMYKDNPGSYVGDLYDLLQFGDQPLGWDIGGEEKTVQGLKRQDFVDYINDLYVPSNMVLVFAGKLPVNILQLSKQHFASLSGQIKRTFQPIVSQQQDAPRVNIHYRDIEQVNLVLGVEGYGRNDPKKFAARLLSLILGGGMSSRLFLQIRERRGLAYHISSHSQNYIDTGSFFVYAGLRTASTEEAVKVIKNELENLTKQLVRPEELKKAKEMERGRIALRSESSNFLAEYFAARQLLDKKLETFDQYLAKIDAVTAEDIRQIAQELFQNNRYNLQIIGPLKDSAPFEQILNK